MLTLPQGLPTLAVVDSDTGCKPEVDRELLSGRLTEAAAASPNLILLGRQPWCSTAVAIVVHSPSRASDCLVTLRRESSIGSSWGGVDIDALRADPRQGLAIYIYIYIHTLM